PQRRRVFAPRAVAGGWRRPGTHWERLPKPMVARLMLPPGVIDNILGGSPPDYPKVLCYGPPACVLERLPPAEPRLHRGPSLYRRRVEGCHFLPANSQAHWPPCEL